jgi:hypothetical protein
MEGLRFSARRVAGRFMWPGMRFEGGGAVVAALWQATGRLPQPSTSRSIGAPRWLVLLWLLPVALIPISLTTTTVADAEEWDTDAIIRLAIVTDLLWIAAGVMCMFALKVIEKRLRRREIGITSGRRSTEASGV